MPVVPLEAQLIEPLKEPFLGTGDPYGPGLDLLRENWAIQWTWPAKHLYWV